MILLILILALALFVVIVALSYWKILSGLYATVAKLREWSARLHVSGQCGAVAVGSILDGLIVILLGIILVFTFIPIIEINSSTANITNETTQTFADLATWLLPVLAVIGLLYLGIRMFVKRSGGKG